MMGRHRKSQEGFTLIEISIGLIILGLVAVAFLVPYDLYRKNKVRGHNEQTFEAVTMALASFVQQQRRFPCPADPALAPGDANFGEEVFPCGGIAVRAGAVPVRTLNLPYRMMADPFGAKLTYAVTTALAGGAFGNGDGQIPVQIVNGAGALLRTVNAQFIIVSHGPDMKGARMMSGAAGPPCGAGARDSENCNGNATFRDAAFSPQNNTAAATHFDDLVSYTLVRKETTMWQLRETGGRISIYNRDGTTNVGIGTPDPESRLHIVGGNLEIRAAGANTGTLSAAQISATQDVKAAREVRAGRFSDLASP